VVQLHALSYTTASIDAVVYDSATAGSDPVLVWYGCTTPVQDRYLQAVHTVAHIIPVRTYRYDVLLYVVCMLCNSIHHVQLV